LQSDPINRGRCLGALNALLALGIALLGAAGCGYHVAGRGARMPWNWKSMAVPMLVNRTSHYRIEQRLTDAMIHELLARTSYHVIQDQTGADAVLRGEIVSIETSPVLFDATTGRVTTMLVTVHANVQLTDRESKSVVYHNDDLVFRDEYQISTDVASFFEEQDPALERMARDFAAQVVSNVLENF
jgi:outer membrane lipopolysaccharide assembly protein LptE/RlpB